MAELLKSGASDEALAEAMVPIINCRFLQGHTPIPGNIAQDAKRMLVSPVDILKPGVYEKGALLDARMAAYGCSCLAVSRSAVLTVTHTEHSF